MLEKLPHCLPFMWYFQHQINLVLGFNPPNRPAYKLITKEAEELQRQVVKLLDKKYIQESINPIAVPSLLVYKNDGS